MLNQLNSQFGVANTRYELYVVPYYVDDSTKVDGMD